MTRAGSLPAVAHVLLSFDIGGLERVALDLAVEQRAAGCRVIAVPLSPPDGPLALEFRAHGIPIHPVVKRPGIDFTLPPRLACTFARHHIAVVHTHNPLPLIYGAVASRMMRLHNVHTKHGAHPDTAARMALRRAAARLTDAYVAVSQATAAIARQQREVAEAKLHVIPNGIDLARSHPDAAARAAVRAELGIDPAAWLVGTVGRVHAAKDHALLVRALAPLLGPGFELLIVGDGPASPALHAQVAALDGGSARHVHLTGARTDAPRLLAACDVFTLSSRTEGLPLVLLEAMATALPVVSTAVGGIPAVLEEGATGLLVPSGDEAALREGHARLAGDRELAARLGARGRAIALERYSAERMARDYLALYRRVLDFRGGGAPCR